MARFALLALPFAASSGHAYYVGDRSFEQKVHDADLVVLAIALTPESEITPNRSTAQFQVVKALKGSAPTTLAFVPYDGIAEMSVDCCVVGATYLMLLNVTPTGVYRSVLGQFGVYRVSDPRP